MSNLCDTLCTECHAANGHSMLAQPSTAPEDLSQKCWSQLHWLDRGTRANRQPTNKHPCHPQSSDGTLDHLHYYLRHDPADLKRRSSLPDDLAPSKFSPLAQFDFGLQDCSPKRHSSTSQYAIPYHDGNFSPTSLPNQPSAAEQTPTRTPSYSLFPLADDYHQPEPRQWSTPSSPDVDSAYSSRHPSVSTVSERSRADSVASVKLPAVKASTKASRRRGFVPSRPSVARVRSISGTSSPGICSPDMNTELAADLSASRCSNDISPTIATVPHASVENTYKATRLSLLSKSTSSSLTAFKVCPPAASTTTVTKDVERPRPAPLTCLSKGSYLSAIPTSIPMTPPPTFLCDPSGCGSSSFFDATDSDTEVESHDDRTEDHVGLLRRWTGASKKKQQPQQRQQPAAPRVLTVHAKIEVESQPSMPKTIDLKSAVPTPAVSRAIDWAPVGGREKSEMPAGRPAMQATMRDDRRIDNDDDDNDNDDKNAPRPFWKAILCSS